MGATNYIAGRDANPYEFTLMLFIGWEMISSAYRDQRISDLEKQAHSHPIQPATLPQVKTKAFGPDRTF